MTTLAEEVANNEAELKHLRLKVEADANLIELLKEQNKEQADKIVSMQHEHDLEMQAMSQERDTAKQRAMEVSGIIESLCRLGVDGLRRMRGEEPAKAAPIQPYEAEKVEVARGRMSPPSTAEVVPFDDTPRAARPRMPAAADVERTLVNYRDQLKVGEPQPPRFLSRPQEGVDRLGTQVVPRGRAG